MSTRANTECHACEHLDGIHAQFVVRDAAGVIGSWPTHCTITGCACPAFVDPTRQELPA